MEITVNYGNSPTIPTGVPYENIKPFYNGSITVELVDGQDPIKESEKLYDKLKGLIDPLVIKDMKHYQDIRVKCVCKPTWIKGEMHHAENCFGKKGGRNV